MTPTMQIAANQMRQRIPTEWLIEFQEWTDAALLSLAEDDRVKATVVREVIRHEQGHAPVLGPAKVVDTRAFAKWELDYRIAFNDHVYEKELTAEETQRATDGFARWRRIREEADRLEAERIAALG